MSNPENIPERNLDQENKEQYEKAYHRLQQQIEAQRAKDQTEIQKLEGQIKTMSNQLLQVRNNIEVLKNQEPQLEREIYAAQSMIQVLKARVPKTEE